MNKNIFENKIKPMLQYIGIIGAAITCIAYVIIVIILVQGFRVSTILQTSTFALINAAVGFIVMELLKYQGQLFAQNLPENKAILDQYHNTKIKGKKMRSIKYYWIVSTIRDLFIKSLSLALTSIGIVMIVIEGSKDYKLLLLAAANLVMFICFGLLGLNSSYEFFNNNHIPYIKMKMEEEKKTEQEKKVEEPQGEKKNV